jgi:hypothetical protein
MVKVVENQVIGEAVQYRPGMEEGFAFLGKSKPVYWYKGTPEPVCEGSVRKVPFIVKKAADGNYICFLHEDDWIITEKSGVVVVFSDNDFKKFFSIVSIVQVV